MDMQLTEEQQAIDASVRQICAQFDDQYWTDCEENSRFPSEYYQSMAANGWLAQDLCDILAIPVERPTDVESTARGAAMLAAVGAGLYPSLDGAQAMVPTLERFAPKMTKNVRQERLNGWHTSLDRIL